MAQKKYNSAIRNSAIYPPCSKACDLLVFCYVHKISIYIGVDMPVNRKLWESCLDPKISGWVDVIKGCGENEPITDDSPEVLRKLKELTDAFAQSCVENASSYIWVCTYEDHLFYDVDHIGNFPEGRMWKVEPVSPAIVHKSICRHKEPVIEIGKFEQGITTADAVYDEDELIEIPEEMAYISQNSGGGYLK